jgi:hypothetical protein
LQIRKSWGGVAGGIASYAAQVTANIAAASMEDGKVMSLDHLYKDIDFADVGLSLIEGAVTCGASVSSTITKTMLKKGIKRVVRTTLEQTTSKKVAKQIAKIAVGEISKAIIDIKIKDDEVEIVKLAIIDKPIEEVVTEVAIGMAGGIVGEVVKIPIKSDVLEQNIKQVVKTARKEAKELGENFTTNMRLNVEESVIKANAAIKDLKEGIVTPTLLGASDGFKKEKRQYQAKTKAKSDYLKRIQKQSKQSHNAAKRKNSNIRN